MRSAQLTDRLLGLLKDMAAQKPISATTEIPELDTIIGANAESEMTPSEIECTKSNLSLLRLAVYLSGSKFVTSEHVEESFDQLEGWLNSTLKALATDGSNISPLLLETAIFLQSEAPYAPTWRLLHGVLTILDSIKALAQWCSIASKKGSKSAKLPKDRIESLLDLGRKVHQSAQTNILVVKQQVSESGKLGSLIDLVVGGTGTSADGPQLRGELEKTLDTSSLELFCGELMESWDEGLGGVVAVRL